jgi:hypothetical protein
LAAAGVVAVTFGLAAVAFVSLYRSSLARAVDDAALQRAQILASDLAHDGTLSPTALRSGPSEQTVVQILDPTGRVVTAYKA